jgi:hypothetical protein
MQQGVMHWVICWIPVPSKRSGTVYPLYLHDCTERYCKLELASEEINPYHCHKMTLIPICIALNNLKLGEVVTICTIISSQSVGN